MKITEFIEEDLKLRIDSGNNIPKSLTLNNLSDFYEVSLTPVRIAVNQLIDQKYIIKQENGRLSINAKKAGKSRLKAKETIETPAVDELILDDIIIESLSDETVFLREEACAERFNVGRTAMRGIFSRLAAHGVLRHVPRCGWEVHSYSNEDMCAFLDVRELMEVKALQLSKNKTDESIIKDLIKKNKPTKRKLKMDDGLHNYFIDCSGNSYIKDFFERQGLYWSALFNYAAPRTEMVKVMAEEHCEILESVLNGHFTQAKKVLTQHIRSQKAIIAELIEIIKSDMIGVK